MSPNFLSSFLPNLNSLRVYIVSRKLASSLMLMGCLSTIIGSVQLFRAGNQLPPTPTSTDIELPTEVGWLMVDIGGAVVQPGVYQLQVGERWSRAVQLAGGVLPQADALFVAKQLNLAKAAEDGGKLYIPYAGEDTAITSTVEPGGVSEITQLGGGGISVNTATADELDSLPGIGVKRVEDIIQNRPYTSLEDLVERAVLTQTIMDDLSGLISL